MEAEDINFVVYFAFVDNQVNVNLNTNKPLDSYRDTMIVHFSSLRRFYPASKIFLYTNKSVPINWTYFLNKLQIQNVVIEFEHNPPEKFLSKFQGSLFLLDVIDSFNENYSYVVIDPDVICVNTYNFLSLIKSSKLPSALNLKTPRDYQMNGFSLDDLKLLYKELNVVSKSMIYFGGEFYYLPGSSLVEIKEHLKFAWTISLRRFKEGSQHLKTEEHLMNFALNQMLKTEANSVIRRLWTSARFREVPIDFLKLDFWHVPSEKGRGFSDLKPFCEDAESWFWHSDEEEFRNTVAKYLHLNDHRLWDIMRRIIERITKIYSKS